ncbi:hypothetical protein TNCV_2793791 [Trichonephila clavipes]|nr:hypothetical protein TNCV_2793791 [Trichonephila clavipes]
MQFEYMERVDLETCRAMDMAQAHLTSSWIGKECSNKETLTKENKLRIRLIPPSFSYTTSGEKERTKSRILKMRGSKSSVMRFPRPPLSEIYSSVGGLR